MCETTRRAPVINWNVIFREGFAGLPLLESAPVNDTLNKNIRNVLLSLKADYQGVMIYPYPSKKGVSQETAQDFWFNSSTWETNHLPFKQVTPYQLLEVYLQNGEKVHGASEMRQKWYPTGLKPRTYFAQGGSAFWASTYLRGFFNELADRFVPTNRFSRVDVSRLKLTSEDGRFVIYDFSNFTSNFSEQYPFLKELAAFFEGCTVRLAGPDLTPIYADLGNLIDDYAEICNDLPEYWVGDSVCREVSTSLTHMQAGFLGVFGNLMTCTVPHGLAVRQHVHSDDQQMTAGDDGVAEPFAEEPFQRTLDLLGDAAPEKHFTSNERAIVLKKPFTVQDGCAIQVDRINFPNLNFMMGQEEDMDERFSHLARLTFGQRRTIVHSQLRRFIHDLSSYSLVEWEAGIIESFMKTVVNLMQLGESNINHAGKIRIKVPYGYEWLRPLPLLGWQDLYLQRDLRRYPKIGSLEIVRLVRREKISFDWSSELVEGEVYDCNWSSRFRYLEMSGVIRRIEGDEREQWGEAYEYVHERDVKEYLEFGPEVSTFRVVKNVQGDVLEEIMVSKVEIKTRDAEFVDSYVEEEAGFGRKYINPYTGSLAYHDLDFIETPEGALNYDEDDDMFSDDDVSGVDDDDKSEGDLYQEEGDQLDVSSYAHFSV